MDLTAKTETNLVVLRRIVAMLYALAELADRAHGLLYPARYLVLFILRPAEAIARTYVAGPMDDMEDFRSMPAGSDDFSDALALPASFRMLALILESQMMDDLWLAGCWRCFDVGQALPRPAPKGHGRTGNIRCLLALSGFVLTARLDTS